MVIRDGQAEPNELVAPAEPTGPTHAQLFGHFFGGAGGPAADQVINPVQLRFDALEGHGQLRLVGTMIHINQVVLTNPFLSVAS